MPTFLFSDYIVPPIDSRRFGKSLGVNLLPKQFKLCNFNCIYCECGWTLKGQNKVELPSPILIEEMLEKALVNLKKNNQNINSITFAGNGEPTMHPNFLEIVKSTVKLRNDIFPDVSINILSNGLFIGNEDIYEAYNLVDRAVLKLDSGNQSMYQIINQPNSKKKLDFIIEKYKLFNDKIIIQTIFLKGEKEGLKFDNTNELELNSWLDKIKYISPKEVMIYSLDRDTPLDNLEKISKDKLEYIRDRVRELGIICNFY